MVKKQEQNNKAKIETKVLDKKLTKKQLNLLGLVYNFRFVNSKTIADYYEQPYLQVARSQLNSLCQYGYLAKRYGSSYRLQNRPAEYYLTPKAIPIIRKRSARQCENELRQIYARSSVSARFIELSLAMFKIRNQFDYLYCKHLRFLTKSQLNIETLEYLPRPLPDAFMTLGGDENKKRRFFIEYFDDAISIGIHGRKIANYMKYKEDGEWSDLGPNFPTVLIICQSDTMLKRAEKRIRYFENQEYSEISFKLISLDKFMNLNKPGSVDYSDPIERELVAL